MKRGVLTLNGCAGLSSVRCAELHTALSMNWFCGIAVGGWLGGLGDHPSS